MDYRSVAPQRTHTQLQAGSKQQQQQQPQTQSTQPQNTALTSGPAMQQAAQTFEVLYEISKLLHTGLTRDQLSLCITLCETGGVNPEALAMAIKELKREAQAMQQR